LSGVIGEARVLALPHIVIERLGCTEIECWKCVETCRPFLTPTRPRGVDKYPIVPGDRWAALELRWSHSQRIGLDVPGRFWGIVGTSAEALPSIESARLELRQVQEYWGEKRAAAATDNDAYGLAKKTLELLEANSWVVLDAATRAQAFADLGSFGQAHRIIDRIQPGNYEDGRYIALIATQAGRIEHGLLFDMDTLKLLGEVRPALDRIIFGTVANPKSEPLTSKFGEYAIITIPSAVVYLLYGMAKSIASVWSGPAKARAGWSRTAQLRGLAAADMAAAVRADPAASQALELLFCSWFFDGSARAHPSPPPQFDNMGRTGELAACAERFVLAHEYGHALIDEFGLTFPWLTERAPKDSIDREHRADFVGTVLLAMSGTQVSDFDALTCLQGAVLALKTHEIMYNAIQLARGDGGDPVWRSETYPSFSDRLEHVIYTFHGYSDYQDTTRGIRAALNRELGLAPPTETSLSKYRESDPDFYRAILTLPAQTAGLLWNEVRPRLERELQSGRRLHAIWDR
jgi:hypothetical protein